MPLRGKLLNTWEVERDLLFRNAEIHDIAVALGVDPHGPGGGGGVAPGAAGDPYGQQPYGQQPYGGPPAQQPPAGPPYAQQPGPGGLTPDERTWGGAAHWSALIGAFVAMAFLGPLLVLLLKGNESAYIRAQAVESLNFQITTLIALVVSFVLMFLLVGFLLLPIVGIWWLVFTIMGSVKSANGELYRYPATIRLVS